MLILIFIIGAIILAAGITIYAKYGRALYCKDCEWVYWIMNIFGTIVIMVCLIAAAAIGTEMTGSLVIDEKIAMYQSENEAIEANVAEIIKEYKEYELGTYESFKIDNPALVLSLYPELKTNELVVKQIEIHTDNNECIKRLKSEKLNYKAMAWWLYFGGI